MRKIRVLFIVAALATVAALMFWEKTSDASSGVPKGSYQQTCKDIKVSDTGISALCQRKNGAWKQASLSSRGFPCKIDIENDDGDLVCIGGK